MRLAIRRLSSRACLPTRAHDGDAGFDLYALEAGTIPAGERAAVATGIAIELPERHAGLVLPRSGLAAEHGIALVNAPGLIDQGYRGEVRVLLLNTDPREDFSYQAGARIAQLIITRVEAPDIVEVAELAETTRGEGGFGSTGT
ncbi:MAG: dUTP pyrophosphatase [Solirubrobacteraceae bacterium]|jgi:dUTP pyrophosphatase|nr:dUTP pyrophosphatase [Solirubrobacteraceae bacterium]MDX6673061.1 dUTP pyrophosphatase [Solirubrobacteraceae bacterium]